jgi:hypothetical protein
VAATSAFGLLASITAPRQLGDVALVVPSLSAIGGSMFPRFLAGGLRTELVLSTLGLDGSRTSLARAAAAVARLPAASWSDGRSSSRIAAIDETWGVV